MESLYGLTKKEMSALTRIFEKRAAILEKVVLYGSRARGDYQNASDIDLAVITKDQGKALHAVKEDLEKAEIIHTVDLIDYQQITNDALRNEIDTQGKLLFCTTKEGGILLTANKLFFKCKDFQKALGKLKDSLARDPHADDLVLDATIQRFEFTYELAWKLMKAYLQYMGNNEATNPRSAIREAYKEGLIAEGDGWLQMLQDRNMTSHTYDEETAWMIRDHIKGKYLDILIDFETTMTRRIDTIEKQEQSVWKEESL